MPFSQQRSVSTNRILAERSTAIMLPRIWLPRVIYRAIPFVYLLFGHAAFVATLYVPEWYWAVPYRVVLAGALFHAAVFVWLWRLGTRRSRT